MTQNQISYARLAEERRSHLVQEAETQRSNLAREDETRRGNDLKYAAEMYGIDVNAATQRRNADLTYYATMHNIDENIRVRESELAETGRRNRAQESISIRGLIESARHNLQSEQLTSQGQHIQAGTSILNNTIGAIVDVAKMVGP